MPVEIRTGNLFEQEDINVIAHQANHRNTLLNRTSSGIASKIEKLYPEAADADDDLSGAEKLGTYSFATGKDGRVVFNVYSQAGQDTSYDALVKAMSQIKRRIENYNAKHPLTPKVLGIPYGYGSNIANGSWQIVEAVFRSLFEGSDVQLVIVRLPGQDDLK
jgi:hypothetical protein